MTLNNVEKVMCECVAVSSIYISTLGNPVGLEITVTTMSQPFSWDTRKKTSATTVAIMEPDDIVNDVFQRYLFSDSLKPFAVTREMLNSQIWNVELKDITGGPVSCPQDWFMVLNFTW